MPSEFLLNPLDIPAVIKLHNRLDIQYGFVDLLLILLICFILHVEYFLDLAGYNGLTISYFTTLVYPLTVFF